MTNDQSADAAREAAMYEWGLRYKPGSLTDGFGGFEAGYDRGRADERARLTATASTSDDRIDWKAQAEHYRLDAKFLRESLREKDTSDDRLRAVVEVVLAYAQHRYDCNAPIDAPEMCTCGYTQALRDLAVLRSPERGE